MANVSFVRGYLEAEKIAVVAHDVGGTFARRLRYWPRTGRALVHHLEMSEARRVASAERSLEAKLRVVAPRAGDVELF
jgi:chemotaxis protein CheD